MRTGPARARGFTLLEVLAATALVAMLAASLYGALSAALTARESAGRTVELMRACEGAMAVLREEIQAAAVPTVKHPFTGTKGSDFTGDLNDNLSFYGTGGDLEGDDPVGDIRLVEFACETDESGTLSLVRRVTTNLLATQTVEPRQDTVCRNVRSLTLRYFDGTDWQESWDSATVSNAAPLAVEVTMEAALPAVLGPAGQEKKKELTYKLCRVISIPCGQETVSGTTTTTSGGSSAKGGTTPKTP